MTRILVFACLCIPYLLVAQHSGAKKLAKEKEKQFHAQLDSISRYQEEAVYRQHAPAFAGTGTNGETFDLTAAKGEIVFVNFWFTSCGPCIKEMPELESLRKKYQDQVRFVSLCLDQAPRIAQTLSWLAQQRHIQSFDWLILPESQPVARKYGVALYPTNLIIDPAGKVHTIGGSNLGYLERRLKKLIKAKG